MTLEARIIASVLILTFASLSYSAELSQPDLAQPHPIPDEPVYRHEREPFRFNIQTSPVALMVRRFNASGEVGVTRSLTLGLKGTTFPQSTLSGVFNTTTGYEVGARSTWYAGGDRFKDGVIFRGGVYYKNTQTNHDLEDALSNALVKAFTFGLSNDQEKTVDIVNGPAFELLGGYQVVSPGGINFDCNLGLTTYQQYTKVVNLTNGSELIYESKNWRLSPLLEFNVGYAF
jgi:hypothetical protein